MSHRPRTLRTVLLSPAAAWILTVARGADFHVSPSGSDLSDGRTPATAWRSLERVNRHVRVEGLRPGDRILLKSGARFRGSLVLSDAGGGSAQAPVLVSASGTRPATIEVPEGTGILVRETPWVTVSNLVLTGTPTGGGDGIRFDRLRPSTNRIAGATVADCLVEGFAWHGVMVDASQRELGYEKVRIRGVRALRNRHAGIQVYGGNQTGRRFRPHADVRIEECLAEGNPGDPDLLGHHSGSGIFVDGAEGVRIAGCVARGNGAECRCERGGPVGIWLHACRDGVIEGNESTGNRSLLRDGGGFDLDGGCEGCVLRRNFAHDNRGPGFLVYTYAGAAFDDRGCRVEENVSLHDGAPGTGYAGLQLGSEEGRSIDDLEVVRNTVVASPGATAVLRVQGHRVGARIARNLLVAAPHGTLTSLSGFGHQLVLEDNHGWREDGRPVHVVDTAWVVSRLADWRNSAGPETRFRVSGETFGDPTLRWRIPRAERGPRIRASWPELGLDPSVGAGVPKSTGTRTGR